MSDLMYFKPEEVAGLVDPVPTMLDHARGFLGLPIRITFTNGGQHCGHSAHYKGLAADLGMGHLAEGFERDTYCFRLVEALMKAGFQRIEIAPLHVHADDGQPPDYPAPVLIVGQEG